MSGLVGWPADQAAERPPPHDLLASWPYRQYLMGLWHVWLPPMVLWVPEGLPTCGGLWRAVAPCGSLWRPIGCPLLRVWRHRCLMAGGLRLRCPDATLAGWLAWLAGWLGWLGWLAWLAGLAGWLQLAGCCWLAAAGWLTEIRKLDWKVVSHARRSERSADFQSRVL